ncbi:MAG: SgcJ/EcaC family oxidoreductase [Planctomycetia bacterium]|nr:SgcJ/EcaC family oxidoreductase [Planctomycetia bacterium]
MRRFVGLLPIATALAAAGCGASVTAPPARLGARSVEPQLLATTTADPHRRAGVVPDVIARPKPFRVADVTARDHASLEPATMASRIESVAVPAAVQPVAAAEPVALPAEPVSPRVAEIRDMLAGYLRAFNRHDAAAAAAHWAAAAENVNLDTGEVTRGREAVRDVFAALFELDAEAAIDIDVDAIRPLRDDVAVVDGISRVSYSDGDVAGSRFSAVVIREDEQWRLASVRETAAAVEPIASSQAAWSADRGFLVRTHVSTPDEHPAGRPAAGDAGIPGLLPAAAGGRRELSEIIGWDPDRETIRSWLFSADGRFAEGTWSRAADGWIVKLEGHGRDAGRTATCTLTPDGGDGLVMRCEGDGLEGLLPPACGYARTAR